jgi:nicotinate-nucleotide adenylyltransferase
LRLAILGGTFDPIHRAHLALAREAMSRFRLDRVMFVPASRPPHKSGVTHASYADRVRMTELACAGEPRTVVSRLEEGTASYSIDTITRIRETLLPGDELFFVIGADAFAEIETWRRWQDVVRSVIFIVASRPGGSYKIPEGASVERLDGLELPYSSSGVRGELAAGRRPSEVPDAVLEYILEHGLYGTREASAP